MARQAEVEATVGGNVKGHQTLERQTPMTPQKIVHPMIETLDKIRQKLKLAWKSNMVDINLDGTGERSKGTNGPEGSTN
uniref:Uncharacterized protein n=1 Tax=Romanomermis culicivorax TaxID=13658 RepID=A0A915HXG6_ROMCU